MTGYLLPVLIATVVGGIASYIYWDLVTMRYWRTGPHVDAYQQRLVERDARRPFDEAWSEWVGEVRARVQADLLLDDFERRVAELWERSERSRLEVAR